MMGVFNTHLTLASCVRKAHCPGKCQADFLGMWSGALGIGHLPLLCLFNP